MLRNGVSIPSKLTTGSMMFSVPVWNRRPWT